MQELVTEYCSGHVWTRDGLDRRTRSLINLVMLTALNRSHVHVRGAVNRLLEELGAFEGRDSDGAQRVRE